MIVFAYKQNTFCRDMIMRHKPRFALIVHDANFKIFGPQGAVNLIEDKNLDEHIPVGDHESSTKKEHTTEVVE